jgi:hypothetical protein
LYRYSKFGKCLAIKQGYTYLIEENGTSASDYKLMARIGLSDFTFGFIYYLREYEGVHGRIFNSTDVQISIGDLVLGSSTRGKLCLTLSVPSTSYDGYYKVVCNTRFADIVTHDAVNSKYIGKPFYVMITRDKNGIQMFINGREYTTTIYTHYASSNGYQEGIYR